MEKMKLLQIVTLSIFFLPLNAKKIAQGDEELLLEGGEK